MTQALITVNGVAGSDTDLPIDTLVQLNNTNNGGEITYTWSIVDQPEGTADTLSSSSIQNPTFTPKKEGTYKIRLIVNQGLGDEKQNDVVCAVLQLKTRQRIPAATETTEADSTAGWKPAVNRMLQLLDTMRADPHLMVVQASGAHAVNSVVYFSGVATIKSGLPGEEDILTVDSALATGTNVYRALAVVVGAVDGGAIGAGTLIYVRTFGLIQGLTLGAVSVGQAVYVSNTGTISATAGTYSRQIGRVVVSGATDDIVFDAASSAESLQSAYNGGNLIEPAGGQGVEIVSSGATPLLKVDIDGGAGVVLEVIGEVSEDVLLVRNATSTDYTIIRPDNIVIGDGSVATPAIHFAQEDTLGIGRFDTSSLGFYASNLYAMGLIGALQLRVPPGFNGGSPGLVFIDTATGDAVDSNTGLYWRGADQLGLSAGGPKVYVDTNGIMPETDATQKSGNTTQRWAETHQQKAIVRSTTGSYTSADTRLETANGSTNGAVSQTIWSRTLSAAQVLSGIVVVHARNSTGSEVNYYAMSFVATHTAGSASVLKVTTLDSYEADAAWSATVDASGNAVQVTVTGGAGDLVYWHASIQHSLSDTSA